MDLNIFQFFTDQIAIVSLMTLCNDIHAANKWLVWCDNDSFVNSNFLLLSTAIN